MRKKYNWAIIGLGKIAHKFVQDLLLTEQGNLYAVASRSQEKADTFAQKYKVEKAFGSYQEMMLDKNIDIVYIATPHVFHCENTLMCLDAGFHVLCEKAFGMNKNEVQSMADKAKEKNLFLMEALWTRFIPSTEKVLEMIVNDVIGDVRLVKADFGFKANFDVNGRLFNKKLGGGSLLDIGIYPVFLSLLTLGKPKNIQAFAQMTSTDVDSTCAMFFEYENGSRAILDSTLESATSIDGWIHGTKSTIKMNSRFHHSERLEIIDLNLNTTETLDIPYVGNGYYHEALEVMECLDNGQTESKKMPLSFSLDLIQTLDEIRETIGLEYI